MRRPTLMSLSTSPSSSPLERCLDEGDDTAWKVGTATSRCVRNVTTGKIGAESCPWRGDRRRVLSRPYEKPRSRSCSVSPVRRLGGRVSGEVGFFVARALSDNGGGFSVGRTGRGTEVSSTITPGRVSESAGPKLTAWTGLPHPRSSSAWAAVTLALSLRPLRMIFASVATAASV